MTTQTLESKSGDFIAQLNAGAATAQAQFAENQAKDRYARRRRLIDFADPVPEEENPNALFRNGWLRKGGAAVLVSTSGAGKSVLATQMCECFAQGRDCIGLSPIRPLKISVYQTEDDETEVAEFRNDIRRGLRELEGWTADEIRRAEAEIVYHDVTGLSGDDFLAYLREAQAMDKADLIVINPLQAFLSGYDISRNPEMSEFFRVRLDPILANPVAPCGAAIIHHTNKVPAKREDRKAWLDVRSAAYAGAGAAELVNWARAVLTLLPREAQGYYDLVAAKRGTRLGWTDADGNPTLIKTIAHTDGFMYWRVPTAEEIAEADARAKNGSGEIPKRLSAIKSLVAQHGTPYSSKKELVLDIAGHGIAKPTRGNDIVDEMVMRGMLIKKGGGKGVRCAYSLPPEPIDDGGASDFEAEEALSPGGVGI